MIKRTVVLLIAITLSACSSIKSIESPCKGTAYADGLTYFMPKKDFLVMITTTGGHVKKVMLGTTSSYPDLSKQYVLQYTRNWFGKNTLDVGVNEVGLLTSTKSTTVSNVADILKNLATAAGQLTGRFGLRMAGVEDERCTKDGEHGFVFDGPNDKRLGKKCCEMEIKIEQIGIPVNVVPHSKKANEKYSGVFYRQNIPYLVTAVGQGLNVASVVFSPSKSQIHFLPVSKTILSNNQAEFGFVEGIPTRYKQETESELLALSKIPADIISGYFAGIGSIFDSFKSKYEKEGEVLKQSLEVELARKKYDACISAINAGKEDLIKQYCQ